MKTTAAILFGIFLFTSGTAFAQLNPDVAHIGIGAGVVLPMGDLADAYNMGYEFHAKNVSHISENFAIGAHLGLQTFSGKSRTIDGREFAADDELQFVLSAGPEYRQDNWFLGLHIGYITGDNEDAEAILIPTAGIMLGGLQIGARYKLLGDYSWFGAGVTYYFLEW